MPLRPQRGRPPYHLRLDKAAHHCSAVWALALHHVATILRGDATGIIHVADGLALDAVTFATLHGGAN
jgi:hypothetical protein